MLNNHLVTNNPVLSGTQKTQMAVAYYRLSSEEKDGKYGKKESSSISNQREIVQDYCKKNGIIIVKEFSDDGYTGYNFDRPGFQDMLDFLDENSINMVLTKDLSRLGRSMGESCYYAERYFPEHRIRYLTVSDKFDSNEMSVWAPFSFAMNEVYVRDTSKKIKDVLRTKRENGEYCSCPPFGYMKSPEDQYKLVPNPATAPIVQRIFTLAAEGNSAHAIAHLLTKEGVVTPSKHRMINGKYTEKGAARVSDDWSHTTVKRILQNPVYLGHTILGKTKSPAIKSKVKEYLPEEEWSVTLNTHAPLVTNEQFEKAKHFMGMNTKAWKHHPQVRKSIFNGMIYCENCGAAMCSAGTVYKGERDKYWYLSCNNISRNDSKRCHHGARIRYFDLLEIIKEDLDFLVSLSDEDIEDIINAVVEHYKTKSTYYDTASQVKSIEKRLAEIDKIINKLYQDHVIGRIDDERHNKMLKSLTEEENLLKNQVNSITQAKDNEKEEIENYKKFFELTKKYSNIEELTGEIIRTFIEKIVVGEKILPEGYKVANQHVPYKQSIKIYYRFIGEGLNIGLKKEKEAV